MKTAFDQWASEVEDSKDYRTQGLRDFYQKNFAAAAENFEKAALQGQRRLRELHKEERRQILQTYDNWKLAGNSLLNLYQFEAALAEYDSASKLVSKDRFANEWADIRTLIGIAKREIGVRSEGDRARLFLLESEKELRIALTVISREKLSVEWAKTQTNLAVVLRDQGIRSTGKEGAKLLSEAAIAHSAALTVRIRDQMPQLWAGTQYNLEAWPGSLLLSP